MLSKKRKPLKKQRAQQKRNNNGIIYGSRINDIDSVSYTIPVNKNYEKEDNFIIITKEVEDAVNIIIYDDRKDMQMHMESMGLSRLGSILCVQTIVVNVLESQIFPLVKGDNIIIGRNSLLKTTLKNGIVNSITMLSRLLIGSTYEVEGKRLNIKHDAACNIMEDIMNKVIGENNVIFDIDH